MTVNNLITRSHSQCHNIDRLVFIVHHTMLYLTIPVLPNNICLSNCLAFYILPLTFMLLPSVEVMILLGSASILSGVMFFNGHHQHPIEQSPSNTKIFFLTLYCILHSPSCFFAPTFCLYYTPLCIPLATCLRSLDQQIRCCQIATLGFMILLSGYASGSATRK